MKRGGGEYMNIQKIFLITPLGRNHSPERCHADKMWDSVFKPLSDKRITDNIVCEFVSRDLLPESGNS